MADRSADVGRAGQAAPAIRFALEVSPSASDPVYVLVSGEDAQPGWIRVLRGSERVYLVERCEVPDCGRPAAVCGLSIPVIQRLGGTGPGSIELVWNGTMSVTEGAPECESRVPAPPGAYVARFCYASAAEYETGADPALPAPGRLGRATCRDVPFTLDDTEVVLRIP